MSCALTFNVLHIQSLWLSSRLLCKFCAVYCLNSLLHIEAINVDFTIKYVHQQMHSLLNLTEFSNLH